MVICLSFVVLQLSHIVTLVPVLHVKMSAIRAWLGSEFAAGDVGLDLYLDI